MEPSRTLSVELPASQLEEAITTAALEVLKRFLAPVSYGNAGEGWSILVERINREARSILAGRDLRPMVQEAIDRVAPEAVEVVCREAMTKAAARRLRDRPGIVLQQVQQLLGQAAPAPEEVADGR